MSTVTREHLAGLYRVADAVEGRSSIRKNGMIDGHILLRDIREWIAQASAAPEQEPAIYAIHAAGQEVDPDCELAFVDEAMQYDEDCRTALYTHSDPSETEQLRAELAEARRNEHNFEVAYRADIEKQDEIRADRDAATQRADAAERKLGERDALLRDARRFVEDWGDDSTA